MTDQPLKPGWQTYRFDRIAINVNDRVEPGDTDLEYYVGLEHLDSDSLKIRRWGTPDDVEATKLRFRKGDIIFGRRRVYQRKLAVADFDGICSAHAMVLRPRTDVVLPEFLPFFMQSDLFMNRALEISVGSLSPTINWKTLAAQEFPLPPLAEQRRIAEVLGCFVRGSEAIQKAIEKLRLIRDAVIVDQSVKMSVHGHLELRQLVTAIESGNSPSGRPEPAGEDEYGVLKVSAVGDWEFDPIENKRIDITDYVSELAVRSGDFLVTRANADPHSVGRTCLVRETPEGLMLSDKTWRILFKPDNPFHELGILAWTKSPIFRKHIMRHLAGTEAKNISQAKFLAGPFPACPPEDFNSFASKISEIRGGEAALYARLDHLQILRNRFVEIAGL